MGVFGDNARKYWDIGLSPLPIRHGEKRPDLTQWQRYCSEQPSASEQDEWLRKFRDHNMGLAMGSDVHGMQLIAIDVDDERYVEITKSAIGVGPMKKGKKGLTIFALADKKLANTKIKAVGDDGKLAKFPAVEILCHGSQTVIPPSIHPDGMTYEWVNFELLRTSSSSLPIVTDGTIDEIRAICQGKGEALLALNDMVWRGVDGGGNTHDVCLSAVGCMVARNWTDPDIHSRIERAKREACHNNGDEYHWPASTKIIQEWIDSARSKGMTNRTGTGAKKVPPERTMADWAMTELGGMEKVVCWRGQLRYYKDGYWPEADVPEIMKKMYATDETLKERDAKAGMNILHTMTQVKLFGFTPGCEENPRDDVKRQRVCLTNGTLNLRTGNLEKHDPEHQLLHQLNFAWEDEATCPTYERVLQETFDGDQGAVNLWEEFCALTLVDDMSFQKLLFLKGPGGNGKGTLAKVLRNMHDVAAVGSVAVTDLNDERKRTSLVGKLVNISGEQSRLNLVSDTYLKKITGGDPVDVRRLYGETQNNVQMSVRFLELVNEMPSTSDNSHALKRRIMILNCPNKVSNPDTDLDRKLYSERCGTLKRWVAALGRLYERGHFDIPEQSHQAVEEYMTENDPVKYWFNEKCRTLEEKEQGTHTAVLYTHYREWSDAMGFRNPMNEIQWGKRLTSMGFPSEVKKVAGQNVRLRALQLNKGQEF